jgi:hypothetical protein
MTTLGGIGHTLPFLLSNFWVATWIAVAVVAVELAAISWIRNRYMDTPRKLLVRQRFSQSCLRSRLAQSSKNRRLVFRRTNLHRRCRLHMSIVLGAPYLRNMLNQQFIKASLSRSLWKKGPISFLSIPFIRLEQIIIELEPA